MRLDELERLPQERLDAIDPAPRAELLHVLLLPDFERADRIGDFWSSRRGRAFAELLIDSRRIGRSGRGGRTPPRSACLGWSVLPEVSPFSDVPICRSRLMYGPNACVRIQIAIRFTDCPASSLSMAGV